MRDVIRTRPPSTASNARIPSHFISYTQPGAPSGGSAATASIGRRSVGTAVRVGSSGGLIRCSIHCLASVRNRAYLPWTRSPWKVTITSSSRSFSGS